MTDKHEDGASASVDTPNPSIKRQSDENLLWLNWYEAPREDPSRPEVYTYTDAMSYIPGDAVEFRSSCNAETYSLEIIHDGANPRSCYKAEELVGTFQKTPEKAYRDGCDWSVTHSWTIPKTTPSGFYKVISRCRRSDNTYFTQYHFFVIRPTAETKSSEILMILPTGTWTAYNDWGGANHYEGIDGPSGNDFSPSLSLKRPWTQGIVWLPPGAPRINTTPTSDPGDIPRYQVKEWAFANGFGRYYAASGWAQYDRHFVQWAEREGYQLDMITQTDLHFRPTILDQYKCVVIVGHDEYWTRQMRENLEAFTKNGGNVARFGANFLWQTRLENEGDTQVCYKYSARDNDPVRGTHDHNLLTGAWEDIEIDWPGVTTMGVNGYWGVYAGFGGFMPRCSKGFTVYRPAHWVFENTDLYYGDVFGHEANIFAYEVDGLDYTFRHGLPYPTGSDGAPDTVEILAMNVATMIEEDHGNEGATFYIYESEAEGRALALENNTQPETIDKHKYGSGMLVHMKSGKGQVVCAATCEWVMGLKRRDYFTETITRNILNRFSEKTSKI